MRRFFKRRKYSDEIQSTAVTPRTIGQVMAEWDLTAPDYITSYDVSYFEDYMYIKIYYTIMTVSQKNDLFLEISEIETEYSFLGVREYYENHEMCFVFRKNGYKINV